MWKLTIALVALWLGKINCQTTVDTYCSTRRCYSMHTPEAGAITWQGAFDACQAINQQLAIIQDLEAQKTLKRFIKVPGSDGHSWVAGRRSDDSTWRDVNDQEFSGISTLGDWRCAAINFHVTKASQISVTNWLCLDESVPLRAVCQYTDSVVGGVLGFFKNGKQYIVSPAEYHTWNEARQYCINNNGDLAYSDVTDPEWQAFFWGQYSSSRLWVGVCKNCWKWKVGQDELPMVFTNWEDNEGANIEENCLHLDLNEVGINYWADKPCDSQVTSSSYICETLNIHGTPSHISPTISGLTPSTTTLKLTTSLAATLPTQPTLSTSTLPPVIPTTSFTTPTTTSVASSSSTTPSTLASSSSATTTTQPPSTSRKPSPTERPTVPTDPVNPIPRGNDTDPTLPTNKPIGTTRRTGPTPPTNTSITPPTNAPNVTSPTVKPVATTRRPSQSPNVTAPTIIAPTNDSSVQPTSPTASPSHGSSLPTVVPSAGSSVQLGSSSATPVIPSVMPSASPGSSSLIPGSTKTSPMISTTLLTAQPSSKASPSNGVLTSTTPKTTSTPVSTTSKTTTLKSSTESTTVKTLPMSPTIKPTAPTTEANAPVKSKSKPDFSINSTNFYIILLTLVGVCVVVTFGASFYFVRRSRNRKRSKVVRHRDAATSFNAHMAAGVVPSGSLSSLADIKDLTLPIPNAKFLSPSSSVCDDDNVSVAVTIEDDERRGSMDSGLSVEHRQFKSGTSLDNWSLVTPTLPRSCLKKPAANKSGDGTLSSDLTSILPEMHKLKKFSDERFEAPLLDSEGRFTAPSSPTPSGFRSRRGSKEIQFTSLRQANKTKSVQWFDNDTYSKAKSIDSDDDDMDDGGSGALQDDVVTISPTPPIDLEPTLTLDPETQVSASPNKEDCRVSKGDSAQAEILKFPDTTTDRRLKPNVQYEDIDEVLDNVKNLQMEAHTDAGDYKDIPVHSEALTPRSDTGSSGSETSSSNQTDISRHSVRDSALDHSEMEADDVTSLTYGSGTRMHEETGRSNDGVEEDGVSSDSDRGNGAHVDSHDDDSQITLLENDYMSRL